MRAISIRRACALCASMLSLLVFPAFAGASASQSEIDAATDKAVAYLLAKQDAATGGFFDFGADWLATALAASGINAADVRVGPGDPSLQDYLHAEYASEFWGAEDPPLAAATDYERVIIVAQSAGLDSARLAADSNLPAQLAGRWNQAKGSFGEASTNSTVFGILALRATPLPRWALAPAVEFLRANQHDDGGWKWPAAPTPTDRAETSEEDISAAALAALCEAGLPAYDPAVAAGLAFLRGRMIDSSGGIEYLWGFPPDSPNADTNARVVAGLTACGVGAQSAAWTSAPPNEKTPIDFLPRCRYPTAPKPAASPTNRRPPRPTPTPPRTSSGRSPAASSRSTLRPARTPPTRAFGRSRWSPTAPRCRTCSRSSWRPATCGCAR